VAPPSSTTTIPKSLPAPTGLAVAQQPNCHVYTNVNTVPNANQYDYLFTDSTGYTIDIGSASNYYTRSNGNDFEPQFFHQAHPLASGRVSVVVRAEYGVLVNSAYSKPVYFNYNSSCKPT
jgi:hypothetical protein